MSNGSGPVLAGVWKNGGWGRDLIETCQSLKGLDRVDMERMSPIARVSRTRGYSLRIEGHSFRTEIRRMFFSQKVIEPIEFTATDGC